MVIQAPTPTAAPPIGTEKTPAGGAVSAIAARAPIFQGVDPGAVTALMTTMTPVGFVRRERIYRDGEPGDLLYVIASGTVKLATQSPDGRSHLLAVLGPAEMFGELCIFDPGPRTATATALTQVHALTVDREVFRAWVAGRPELAERLLRVLARRLRRTDDDRCDLIFTDAGARIAKHLLRLAQQFGVHDDDAIRVTHHLTQEEIAHLVGTARETVNKILTDFTARGWIRLDGKSLLILHAQALRHRAHHSPGPDTANPAPPGSAPTSPASPGSAPTTIAADIGAASTTLDWNRW